MIKVMTVFGTRPEAIKMAPLVKELEKRSDMIESIVCVTAQHRDMLDQVLYYFNINPDFDLDIMSKNQTLSSVTCKVLEGMQEIFDKNKPDLVLVHGDTSTAYVAALCAFYNQINIGHVEAGLRTYDKYSPFPEEMNRQMIDRLSDIYFAPTEQSKKSLIKEGVDSSIVCVTGNTVIDAMRSTVQDDYSHKILDWVGDSRMVLLTAHRRENLGEPMIRIFRAIKRVVDENPDVKVVYPVHLNPKVQEAASSVLNDVDRVKLIDPLDVFDFHNFQNKAYIILTDSGGVQEEAPSLGKPVLVLRDTTERPEGVAAGTLLLVGTNEEDIYMRATELLTDDCLYDKMSSTSNPYGDGTASRQIVDAIIEKYKT